MNVDVRRLARWGAPFVALAVLLLLRAYARDDSSATKPAPSSPASAKESPAATELAPSQTSPSKTASDSPPRIKANNSLALKERVGQELVVWGKVASATVSKNSGHHILKFASSELSVICLSENLAAFGENPPAKRYLDQHLEVRGKLELHNGRMQIQLADPAAGKILDPAEAERAAIEPVELKNIGKDAWQSPAGLIYRGRDVEGNTRKEHVLRHARDIPDRDGPHGVFDGGEEAVFAVIDEAWKLAKARKIRPSIEGDRSTYTILMDRRIGYLGGTAGAAAGRPALNRLFLVVDTKTNDVITAFPK